MVNVISIIASIIILIIILVIVIKYRSFRRFLINNFKTCNVVVSGKKGKGKDILFQYIINARKDFYYSNISYGGKHKIVALKDISCSPNTYQELINDKVEKQPHIFKENKDFYISDGSNFLPSQMDSTLHKKFPSMPIFYSLSRHLYNCNIHVNCQSYDRLWKALREQADLYITVKGTIKIFNIFITRMVAYEKLESAKCGLLPMRKRIGNKYSKAQYDKYVAENGLIKVGFIITTKRKLKYDTRAFEKIMLCGRRKH